MANTTEIAAKLGIDHSEVPKDLAEANAFFKKFAAQIEKDAEKAGGGGGVKFAKSFASQMSGQARGAIVAALGLSAQGIADKIAEYFAGGTKEAWEAFGKTSDENSKLIAEKIRDNLTDKQYFDSLIKQLGQAKETADSLAQGLSSNASAEERTKAAKAQNDYLLIEKEVLRIKKEQKKAEDDLADSERKAGTESLEGEQKLGRLRADAANIQAEIDSGLKSELEVLKLKKELSSVTNEIKKEELSISKDIADEVKKSVEDAKKREASIDAANKKIKGLQSRAGTIQGNIAQVQTTAEDRNKATLGELAALSPFQAGVSIDAANAGQKARDALDLETKANAARLSGDRAGAGELFAKAGVLRDELVGSGSAKSTEGDPAAAVVTELKVLNTDLTNVLEEIKEVEKGKFKNQ